MNILVINSGSSTIKLSIINPTTQHNIASALVDRLSTDSPSITLESHGKKHITPLPPHIEHRAALTTLLQIIDTTLTDTITAIGHRVVHGGEHFSETVLVTPGVLEKVRACTPLAPLHNPENLNGIAVAQKLFPDLPQAVVFDTAFHQTLPEKAFLYAIPYRLYREHRIKRYGFHGISHRYVAAEASKYHPGPPESHRLITAHLGNGCSLAAIQGQRSIDTTMGFTPLEGLVMGTRCGNVDPSLSAFLQHELAMTEEQITHMYNYESGLLGISELTNDMRLLEAYATQGHAQAKRAIDLFVYRLAQKIAAMAVPLAGVDSLVFTGGIGENSSLIRSAVIKQLRFIGLQIDPAKNRQPDRINNGIISPPNCPRIIVIPTNEELMIARETHRLLQQEYS